MRWRWWLMAIGAATVLPSQWARLRSAGRIRTLETVPESVEVALVLGAGVRYDGVPSRILQGRLNVARQLYEQGKVKRILVSGSPHSRGHSEPLVMRRYLTANGVCPADVVLDESGVDTWCSARAAAESFGLRQVVVVSTNFHLPRSIWLCRRAGMEAYGVGHDARADGLRRVAARGARRELLATMKAFWLPRS